MLKLTTFAGIARQYDVPFEVQFTKGASYVQWGGTKREWLNSPFWLALYDAGIAANVRIIERRGSCQMQLESLT